MRTSAVRIEIINTSIIDQRPITSMILKMIVRVCRRVRDRRRPELVLTARQLSAMASAGRNTPPVLRDRRQVRRRATVADEALPVLGRWQDPTGAL